MVPVSIRSATAPIDVRRLGTVDYQQAWQMQRELADARIAGGPDTLLLLEHPSVYTAGKRTLPEERPLPQVSDTPVIDTDRGGKITWHGPGQLVGYPVIGLAEPLDVVNFVRRLEESLMKVCADLGLETCRIDGRSGVWVPGFGVHLNSMLGEGELVREVLHPGVRMGSMMSPLVALDAEDRLYLAAGAAGGSRIRPALVQSVLRMLTGSNPQQAIDAPRLNALPDTVRLEPGFAEDVIAALQAAGNEVLVAGARDAYFGGVSALSRLGGGADPRRSGTVIML